MIQARQVSRRSRSERANSVRRSRGFTLLEVMVALTITLILMGLVVEVFSRIGKGVNNSRANMELNDQLRNAKHRLIQDLRGITCPMTPPLDPYMNLGYFEYVEGPRVASTQAWNNAIGSSGGDIGVDLGAAPSSSQRMVNSVIGDTDDILMFTTASYDNEQFVGKGGDRNNMGIGIQGRFAEVAWYLRNASLVTAIGGSQPEFFNLHRRAWLVLPDGSPFTGQNDIAQRPIGGNNESLEMPPNTTLVSDPTKFPRRNNPIGQSASLSDLTRRECRSLHQPYLWPFDMMYVPGTSKSLINSATGRSWDRYAHLSLPTMEEQSAGNFPMPMERVSGLAGAQYFVPKNVSSPGMAPLGVAMGAVIGTQPYNPGLSNGARIGEDIILTNVVSFDIKAWDPGAPVFAAAIGDSAAAAASTANPIAAVLVPGDAGYPSAVDNFLSAAGNTALQPVGFGAYADLNYMGSDHYFPDCIKRWTNYAVVGGCALEAMENNPPYSGGTTKCRLPRPAFAHPGEPCYKKYFGYPYTVTGAGISAYPCPKPAVYDTWSTHYEYDGHDNDDDGLIDEMTNGADDNLNGLIDEPNVYDPPTGASSGERDAPPPYRSPLRGIKITIRVMEQESKQVREVTVVQEFVPL